MNFFRKISLKVKLISVIASLTGCMLIAYAFLALSDFETDKTAYVFDSNMSHSKATANQIRSELEFTVDKIRFYLRGYDPTKLGFGPEAREIFLEEPLIEGLFAYQWDVAKNGYELVADLKKPDLDEVIESEIETFKKSIIQETLDVDLSLRTIPQFQGKWILSLKIENLDSERPTVVMAALKKGNFIESFASYNLQNTYLVSSTGETIISSLDPIHDLKDIQVGNAVRNTLQKVQASAGISEYKTSDGQEWLIAMAKVGAGRLKVVSIIPRSAALEALRLLFAKSVLFLLLLICITVFVSVFSSIRLTSTLKRLFEATKKVGQGDFDVQVNIQSEDEIGGLARGFNHMTQEIKRLMDETVEKARMESELQTAQLVQMTLFPEEDFKNDDVEIKGYYMPASECGGDWWFYNQIENKTYLWIGDATGHGVPAALVTSAARSASGILENFPDLALSKVMSLLNKAIHGTAKGQVMMTFFLACFDKDKGKLTYCNASHDPPFYIPTKEKLTKKDLVPLFDNIGARLGESPDSEYTESCIDLHPGDRIVFYTDGVIDLSNEEGQTWGERKFIQSLINAINESEDLSGSMKSFNDSIEDFRGKTPLNDDITYVLFEYQKVA